jgi:hypothetical protein
MGAGAGATSRCTDPAVTNSSGSIASGWKGVSTVQLLVNRSPTSVQLAVGPRRAGDVYLLPSHTATRARPRLSTTHANKTKHGGACGLRIRNTVQRNYCGMAEPGGALPRLLSPAPSAVEGRGHNPPPPPQPPALVQKWATSQDSKPPPQSTAQGKNRAEQAQWGRGGEQRAQSTRRGGTALGAHNRDDAPVASRKGVISNCARVTARCAQGFYPRDGGRGGPHSQELPAARCTRHGAVAAVRRNGGVPTSARTQGGGPRTEEHKYTMLHTRTRRYTHVHTRKRICTQQGQGQGGSAYHWPSLSFQGRTGS